MFAGIPGRSCKNTVFWIKSWTLHLFKARQVTYVSEHPIRINGSDNIYQLLDELGIIIDSPTPLDLLLTCYRISIQTQEHFITIPKKSEYSVLFISKPQQPQAYEMLDKIIQSQRQSELDMNVYVLKSLSEEDSEQFNERFASQTRFFLEEDHEHQIDACVTFGGDGTILYTANKFQNRQTPPILSISGGTLGFMCVYSFEQFLEQFNNLLLCMKNNERIPIERKMRLQCIKRCKKQKITQVKHAINELVVERGPKSSSLRLKICINNIPLTALQADGLIVNTPTGSTAYSLSSGGPIIYNDVNSICIVPISPLSLSFRPIVLHPEQHLKIKIHPESRNEGKVVGDGQFSIELNKEEEVTITSSAYDVLIINDQRDDNNLQNYIVKLKKMLRWSTKFKAHLNDYSK